MAGVAGVCGGGGGGGTTGVRPSTACDEAFVVANDVLVSCDCCSKSVGGDRPMSGGGGGGGRLSGGFMVVMSAVGGRGSTRSAA